MCPLWLRTGRYRITYRLYNSQSHFLLNYAAEYIEGGTAEGIPEIRGPPHYREETRFNR